MGKQECVYVIYISASPETVWAALTSPQSTRRYVFGHHIECDWNIGSTWTLRAEDRGVVSKGKVIRYDPPRRLSLTWRVEYPAEYKALPEALVAFQIDPLGDVVRLTLEASHPELVAEKYWEQLRDFWPVILSGLKTFLETGKPLPEFMSSK